jgi:hypothetical protein
VTELPTTTRPVLLPVEDLVGEYATPHGPFRAVDHVNFSAAPEGTPT